MAEQQSPLTRGLRKRAQLEYQKARGTTHRAMLREAHRLTLQRSGELYRELDTLRRRSPLDTTEPDHEYEAELDAKLTYAARNLERISTALASLESVTEENFVQAYLNPSSFSSEEIEHYLTGVYAEWESVPDWIAAAFEDQDFNPDQFAYHSIDDDLDESSLLTRIVNSWRILAVIVVVVSILLVLGLFLLVGNGGEAESDSVTPNKMLLLLALQQNGFKTSFDKPVTVEATAYEPLPFFIPIYRSVGYTAQVNVTAGIDLNALIAEALTADGQSLEITLPTPQITSCSLDQQASQYHGYWHCLLMSCDPETNIVLQEKALALISFQERDRILDDTFDQTAQYVENLAVAHGFKTVTVVRDTSSANYIQPDSMCPSAEEAQAVLQRYTVVRPNLPHSLAYLPRKEFWETAFVDKKYAGIRGELDYPSLIPGKRSMDYEATLKVSSGVDLSLLQDGYFEVNDNSLIISLPPAQVHNCTTVTERFYNVSCSVVEWCGDLRDQLREQVLNWVANDDPAPVQEQAFNNASAMFTGMFRLAGFESVSIIRAEADLEPLTATGTCQSYK